MAVAPPVGASQPANLKIAVSVQLLSDEVDPRNEAKDQQSKRLAKYILSSPTSDPQAADDTKGEQASAAPTQRSRLPLHPNGPLSYPYDIGCKVM